MSDTIDLLNEWKKHMALHKAEKAVAGAKALTDAGISWNSHNNGVHLIIYVEEKQINFWPSTGLWMYQGSKYRRHGVESLIEHIEEIGSCGDRRGMV